MAIDVIDLRDFYSRRLGIVARRLINRGIQACWPDAQGQRVLGIGYPTPYLGLFRDDAAPAPSGATDSAISSGVPWPSRPTAASTRSRWVVRRLPRARSRSPRSLTPPM